MTPKQLEFMAKCDHRKTCERLVTLNASSYADPYYWCACAACPYYTNENAKLRELCASLYGYAHDENPEGTELNFADDMRELGVEVTS